MFGEEPLPSGSIYLYKDNNGGFSGKVVSIVEDAVLVDLNHPMTGSIFYFNGTIKMLNLQPLRRRIRPGHVHGRRTPTLIFTNLNYGFRFLK
jgi:FKBP-type peptidyl-prolyl cis-trans isomerase SlyD